MILDTNENTANYISDNRLPANTLSLLSKNMNEETFYNKKRQPVGRLKEGIYRKEVSKGRHLMKRFNAWGIDADIMSQLGKKGCKEIRILDKDDGIIYSATYEDFMNKGKGEDLGEGLQYFLPVGLWDK